MKKRIVEEPEQKSNNRKNTPAVRKTTKDLLPFLEYKDGCYRLKNDTRMDILQIVCKDLVAINEQDREYDFYTLIKLERVLQDDHKIICLNVPTKTGKQCAYLQHKIRSCSDPYRLRQLENKLKEEEWIEKNRSGKEFFLMIFSSSLEEHLRQINTILSILRPVRMIRMIEQEKKDELLEKLCNKILWN